MNDEIVREGADRPDPFVFAGGVLVGAVIALVTILILSFCGGR